jgi:hypothetical protein
VTDVDFQRQVFFHQFQYRQISAVGDYLVEQILLNLPFLFPKGKVSGSAGWWTVIFVQAPTVNEFDIAIQVFVLVSISAVRALALSDV